MYVAGLLHDIGALSIEEKEQLHASDVVDPEIHCIRGRLLFEDIPWLAPAAGIVQHHHRRWDDWSEGLENTVVFGSQILSIADFLERQIDRSRFILHQSDELIAAVRVGSGTLFHLEIVGLFMERAVREEFWFDLVSPRLYSLLLPHGPYRQVILDFESIAVAARFFQNIVDFKSPFTTTHSSGVAACAVELSRIFGLTETELRLMEIAGHLHDIGKLVIPNSLLDKPDKLTPEEFAIVRQHTYLTFTVLNTIDGLQRIAEWASYHHEKLDGTGYPFHKGMRDLDTGGRIMAVADIYTALAEDRPYRRNMDQRRIAEVLSRKVEENALDGRLVRLLLEDQDAVRSAVRANQEEARDLYERKFALG